MAEKKNCPICQSEEFQASGVHQKKDAYHVQCKICGQYIADGMFLADKGSGVEDENRYLLSSIVREANEHGKRDIEVSYDSYPSLIAGREIKDVASKAIKFLRLINSQTKFFGQPVSVKMDYDYPLAFAKNQKEFVALRDYLREAGLIQGNFPSSSDGNQLTITARGLQHLEEVSNKGKLGNQAFIAMWFSPTLLDAFTQGIQPAVEACGYRAIRIDQLEHNKKIDDLIISSINDSNFLIADFTGHRPSVYFEAGYALGQKKEVIWICKDTDIGEAHFDTRQYNHLVWTSAEDLRTKLENRIAAVIGRHNG